MIKRAGLLTLVGKRLKDSEVLLAGPRYEGAYYLCGYAVELALKACICRTLGWLGFPESGKEFEGLLSLKTHDLNILLRLSGRERNVKKRHLADWSVVAAWLPTIRYGPPPRILKAKAQRMLESAQEIVGVLRT
jgi:HEPN domain-containing protein